MKPTDYPFEVRPLSKKDGGGDLIAFPDLPGCMSDGDTPVEAIKNGLDAAKSWLETAREFKDHIPKPKESNNEKIVTRIPKSMHTRLSTQAKREGVSVNTLITAYLAEGLSQRKALS
jgi:antitoxin HicB